MTTVNALSIRPINHLQDFPVTLPEIYRKYIQDKCAPLTISNNAKYILHHPQITSSNIHLQTNDNQEVVSEQSDLIDPFVNAVGMNTSYSSNKTAAYTPLL